MMQRMSAMPRLKKMITLTIDPALMVRLERWLAEQEFPPPKNAVISAALTDWLDARGASKGVQESAPARVSRRSVSKRST